MCACTGILEVLLQPRLPLPWKRLIDCCRDTVVEGQCMSSVANDDQQKRPETEKIIILEEIFFLY